MDPLTLLAAAALLLGAGAGSFSWSRHSRREEMQKAIEAPIACGPDLVLSVFDVFWDLGASEFTLEMLAHRGLLLSDADDLSRMLTALPTAIDEHAGYNEFINDLEGAIQEYRKNDRPSQAHRLASPERKLLAIPGAGTVDWEVKLDRVAGRSAKYGGTLTSESSREEQVDIDQLLDTDSLDVIGSLFSGEGTAKLKRWFGLRAARKLRDDLNQALTALYDTYQAELRVSPERLDHLFHLGKRWEAETTRMHMLGSRREWRDQDWSTCADALVRQAERLCRSLALKSGRDIEAMLMRMDSLAAKGDKPLAGYLVYLNRYALFAGRLELCEEQIRKIETRTHRLTQELRNCRSKKVI